MKADREFCFGPFLLDLANARLTRDRQPVALKPKVFDVLAHLVRNAGRLVTQDELLASVWPDAIVGDSSLKSCIRQIRQALGDDARTPQFIETMHRRGYSFIAAVTASDAPDHAAPTATKATPRLPGGPVPVLVGREGELSQLREMLAHAQRGQRQVAFVAGGPGSGKTALSEVFLQRAASDGQVAVAAGQCFEQFGSGEAYLPLMEALGRLGRSSQADRVKQVLASHAPTWLAQLPALRARHDGQARAETVAPPERMLREMAEALERLTVDVPLILTLEDLHWADYSTLDLVSALARRREPARLMLLATYRPVEAVLSGHPLRAVKQDLQARGLCRELPLGLLSEEAVADYLAARFPEGGLPESLAGMLHQRTEGLPLFLVNLVNDWLEQGILSKNGRQWQLAADVDALAVGVPASIRALIEKQLERLRPDELRALEGASVAGVEFAAAAAAAALDEDVVRLEECCEALTRRHHFLLPRGAAHWPDGTVSAGYRFGHELVHRVVSESLSSSRRQRLHQRLADRLEAAHATQACEFAADLAVHFDHGASSAKAAHYFGLAADRAARQYAHREAIDYIHRGLKAVERMPPSERVAPELRLQLNLGVQLQVTRGFADPQARRAFVRARDLSQQSADAANMFPALWGLWLYHKTRSDLATARTMAQELLALAEQLADSSLVLQAHQALAVTALCSGEPAATRRHMELGNGLYDRKRHHTHTYSFGQDPGVACRAFGALALWLLGEPEQAVRVSRDALQLSHELVQPSSQALALHFSAMLHQCRRDGEAALACADLALTIAAEQGHSFWQAGGTVMRGWGVAECGDRPQGIALMRQGIDSCQSTSHVTYCTYYLAILAETLGREKQVEEALGLLDRADALLTQTSERLYEPELHRLRGELMLRQSPRPGRAAQQEADGCFRKALKAARKQKARSLELRAAASLCRLHASSAKRAEARSLLADMVGSFKEGFDTRDLQEAQGLLKEIG